MSKSLSGKPEGGSAASPVPAVLRATVALIVLLYTAAIVRFVGSYSYFVGDDYLAFWSSVTSSFSTYLVRANTVHVVPLHRIVTLATYGIAPMSYGFGLAVLLVFHGLGVVYLYRTLELLKPSRLNVFLVGFYATNVYLGGLMLWWASGLLRLPYVAFSLMAIYYYLRYRRDLWSANRRVGFAALVVACWVLAVGFYIKSVLIPFYLVGVELCVMRRGAWKAAIRNLVPAGVVLLLTAVYLVWWRSGGDPRTGDINLVLHKHIEFFKQSFAVLGFSAAGIPYTSPGAPMLSWLAVLVGWGSLVAYTVVKAPRSALVWGVGVGLVGVNFLMVGLSNRVVLWGHVVAFSFRFYFELIFLVVLFAGMALHRAAARPIATPWIARVVPVLAVVGMAGIAVNGYQRITHEFRTHYAYEGFGKARRFVENLLPALDELDARAEPVTMLDGRAPIYMGDGLRYSVLIRLLGRDKNMLFDNEVADYRITDTGAIVPFR